MSYSDRKKILFSVILISIIFLVFSTSFTKISNVKNNDLKMSSNLNKESQVSKNDNSITYTAIDNDTIIRSGNTMHIEGTYLYLIENYYDLEVYDISDLAEPVLLSSYENLDLDYDSKMIIQNNLIYIYGEYGTFYILDCSNPLAITEVVEYTSLPYMTNFAINNWSLNLITDTEYQIYDFQNFATPTLIGDYSNTSAVYTDFTIKGNYTYLLDSTRGFEIVDASNNSDLLFAYKSTLNETHMFSTFYINETSLFIFDDTDDILYIFDISLPLIPSLITSSEIYDNIDWIYIKGTLLFSLLDTYLAIADVSELTTPQHLSYYDSEYYVFFLTIVYYNQHIILHNDYIAELQERFPIHIVNINDPSHPVHIYPTDNPYGFPDWLVPALIAGGVLIVVGPLVIVLIIILTKKKP
ncbi:MAG: hypothetical protein ACTSO7_03305 [Candidatus Heimdallarchaeota archaeon]